MEIGIGELMSKYSGKGWHFQSTRHSNARKYGKAGGKYSVGDKVFWSVNKNKIIFGDVIKYAPADKQHEEEARIRVRSSDGQEYEPVLKYVHKYKEKKVITEPQREYGFDLTDFKNAKDFKALLKKHGLTKHKKVFHSTYTKGSLFSKKGDGYYSYSWSNPDGTLELRTGNNPITGVYSVPKQRENEKGFASYMGIKGENNKVEALAKDIKRRATEIKDENPKHNDFIW